MRVWLQPDRMAALNVSPAQVRQALAANNYLAAVGQTRGSLVQVNLTANTDLRSVAEFEQLVVRQENGAVVRLRDVAQVALGAEDYDAAVNFSGQTAVFIGIWALRPRTPSTSSSASGRRWRRSSRTSPSRIQARIAYDGTAYIEDAIREVETTLGRPSSSW